VKAAERQRVNKVTQHWQPDTRMAVPNLTRNSLLHLICCKRYHDL